ncbi:hypothetical protein ACFXK0_26710 [Nocardia sp. NPDC059177]|uniref:hypothetical protein n=1 Tax=Nocardia sp. NPDC059177 TaxID=3346759 RepID=UPI0036C14A36
MADTPLGPLITEAKNGSLSVRMDPEEFAKIEYECQAFKATIKQIQGKIAGVAQLQTWGFGDHAGSQLTSATTMADRFRKKSKGRKTATTSTPSCKNTGTRSRTSAYST